MAICHQNQAKNDVLVADFFGRSCPPQLWVSCPPTRGGAFKIFGACGAILPNLTFLLTKLAKISECPPTRGGHCHQMTKSATKLGGTCHQLGGSALPTWGGIAIFGGKIFRVPLFPKILVATFEMLTISQKVGGKWSKKCPPPLGGA